MPFKHVAIMWKKGELQPILEEAGAKVDDFGGYDGDPFEFLPNQVDSAEPNEVQITRRV